MSYLFLCLLFGWPLHAADESHPTGGPSAERRFELAYQYLVNADESRDSQNLTDAAALYQEAAAKYEDFAADYPHWQPGIVKFRIAYCKNQLGNMRKRMETEMAGAGVAPAATNAEGRTSADTRAAGVEAMTNRADLASLKREAARLLKQGESAKARVLLLDGIRRNPDDSAVRILTAMAQCQAGQFEDASYILTQMVEEEPSNTTARLVLGSAFFGMGQMPRAAEEVKHVLKLNPMLSEAHFNLVQILLNTQPSDRESARYHYRKWLELGGKPDSDIEAMLK